MTEFHVRMDEGTRAPEGATSHSDAELLRLRCEVAYQNLVIHQKAVEAYDLRRQVEALRSRIGELEATEASVAAEEAAAARVLKPGTRVRWTAPRLDGGHDYGFGEVLATAKILGAPEVRVQCDAGGGIRWFRPQQLTVCQEQHGQDPAGRPEPQAVSPERPAAESPEEPAHFLGDQTPTPAEGRVQPGDDLPAFEGAAPWSPQAWERRKQRLEAAFFQTPLAAPAAEPELERITGVAMMTLDGLWSLPAPARHHHVIHAYAQAMRKRCKGTAGFTTSKGRFVTRDEALALATQAKQLIRTPTGTLTSEDLWTTPAPDGSVEAPPGPSYCPGCLGVDGCGC